MRTRTLGHPVAQVRRELGCLLRPLEQTVISEQRARDEGARHAVFGADRDGDRVAGPDVTLADDAEICAGTAGPGEPPEEAGVTEADPELEAGQPGLSDLEQCAPTSQRSPMTASETGRPLTVRFSPKAPAGNSVSSSCAHQRVSSNP